MTLYPCKIGTISRTITAKDAYFGSSPFIDLIHQLQLEISGAEVSFCAPLSFRAEIKEGDIYVSDMFNLYKVREHAVCDGTFGQGN